MTTPLQPNDFQQHKIATTCRDCIFAIYNLDEIQTGCQLGDRLNKFVANHTDVYLVQESSDSKKQNYFINGRYCLLCRNHKWQSNLAPDVDAATEAYREAAMQYNLIIFADNNLDKLFHTLTSVYKQQLLPTFLTIIQPLHNKLPSQEIASFINVQDNYVQWRIENITRPSFSEQDCVKLICQTLPQQYYAIVHSGIDIPSQTFSDINTLILDDLLQFYYIDGNTRGDGCMFSHAMYRFFHDALSTIPLPVQIKYHLEENNITAQRIFDIGELCPYFPK